MRDKIFVAGVYGAGKTYFSKKLAESSPDHEFISFDESFYGSTSGPTRDMSPIDRLWGEIRKHDKFVIDGVPCDMGNGWDSFYDYYDKHDCQAIILNPSIDAWKERLLAAPWYNPLREEWCEEGRPFTYETSPYGNEYLDIDKHIENFNIFYEQWPLKMPADTVYFDPKEPTEILIKRLGHE